MFLHRFFRAAEQGDVDEVRRLVGSEGVDPEATEWDAFLDSRQTALHIASMRGHLPLACYLVEEVGVEVDTADDYGWTALHYAADDNDVPLVRYLLETGGANVEARDDDGNTPLHLASLSGNKDMVKYLVERQQANVNARDKRGDTPLDGTRFRRQTEVVLRYLLPRASCIARDTLTEIWKRNSLVDIRGIVLEKYALGHGLANAFRSLPIHTLFVHFPLSAKRFQDAIRLFPSSVLCFVDTQGRLSVHVALTSQVAAVKSPRVISTLFERERRAALARDPITGFYPHETAASIVSNGDDDYEIDWLDLIYEMFRSNPQQVIQCRFSKGTGASLPDAGSPAVERGPKSKRPKVERRFWQVP